MILTVEIRVRVCDTVDVDERTVSGGSEGNQMIGIAFSERWVVN